MVHVALFSDEIRFPLTDYIECPLFSMRFDTPHMQQAVNNTVTAYHRQRCCHNIIYTYYSIPSIYIYLLSLSTRHNGKPMKNSKRSQLNDSNELFVVAQARIAKNTNIEFRWTVAVVGLFIKLPCFLIAVAAVCCCHVFNIGRSAEFF